VVGSLAHTNDICIAVTAWKHQAPALGIDVEPDQAMDDSLWAHVCAPDELAALNTLPPALKGRRATQLFCAKEAFYKWQYPQTGRLLEFHDVRIEIGSDNTRFRARVDARIARLITPSPPPDGRLMRMDHCVIAFIGT
jgi:enterobactin synthetase component D